VSEQVRRTITICKEKVFVPASRRQFFYVRAYEEIARETSVLRFTARNL